MMVNDSIVEILTRPIKMEERDGPRGVKYKYVKGETVIERLNEAFRHEWSSEVINETLSGDFIVLRVRLTVMLEESRLMYKEAYGGATVMRHRSTNEVVDLANAYKSALTNGIKKAAEQFGIGLTEDIEETGYVEYKKAPAEPKKPVGTATSSVVVKTAKSPEVSDDAMEKARKMMAEISDGAEKSKPAPSESNSASEPFPKSPVSSTDKASDLQKGAIAKLAASSSMSVAELIKMASEGDEPLIEKLGKSLVGKTNENELTKLEAAAIIRFISSKNASK